MKFFQNVKKLLNVSMELLNEKIGDEKEKRRQSTQEKHGGAHWKK